MLRKTRKNRNGFKPLLRNLVPLRDGTPGDVEVTGECCERRHLPHSVETGFVHCSNHEVSAMVETYSLTNVPSSQSTEDPRLTHGYDGDMELRERIFKARTDAKLTQDQLAEAVRKTRSAVSQWESGDVRPRHSTLVAIATATGKDLRWLESGLEPDVVGMRVIGEVAAGLWKEGSVEFRPYGIPVAPHPGYPSELQRLYKVSGTSVNKIVEDGAYVHCVSVVDGGIVPENGDLVIVCRQSHGLSEYTAKRLVIEDGKKILRPESTDEQWQADIHLDGDEETTVVITDVVIAKWSPLRRGL